MQCKTHIECTGIKIRPVQQKPTFNSMIQRTDKHSLPLLLINIYNCFIIWNSVMFKLNWAFLVNKTNRCTEFQFYWYYDSTYFGQPFCPSSGVLSHTSALVHFMQLWWPFATDWRACSIPLLVANGHRNCIKCTKADVWLRTPDDGQKGCPKHVES